MNVITFFRRLTTYNLHSHKVALVLSGGGARGLAHIGAIEELQRQGYEITSVAGTSMGSLVGGFFACGQLQTLKDRVLSLTRKELVKLLDFSLGLDHVATGDNLLKLMDELLGGARIEELKIPFCCCASDLYTGREKVYREGPLAEAIRASISIPCFFKPWPDGDGMLVDGSVHNIFPLDRVERHKGDILVGVNVSAPEEHPMKVYRSGNAEGTLGDESVGRFMKLVRNFIPKPPRPLPPNYINMVVRVCCLTLQGCTQTAMRLTPPDICVNVPMDVFGLFDYEHAAEIIEYGRQQTAKALLQYSQA
jgi:NTE family protein